MTARSKLAFCVSVCHCLRRADRRRAQERHCSPLRERNTDHSKQCCFHGRPPAIAASSGTRPDRTGGTYIAVLGTAMIVALLGMAALIGQRIQNRIVVASADIRQAELNANTAVQLALLAIDQDPNWRSNQPDGGWFTNRAANDGTCSLEVIDPNDANLANNSDDPFLIRGIGYSGDAEQRVELMVDPRQQPLDCLRFAIAAGDKIDLNNDTLRTNGLVSADTTDLSSSTMYGDVIARSVQGSTYVGTTAQVPSSQLPTMPDWTSVFEHYRDNGTELSINSLPIQTPNLGRNVSIENGTTDWTGSPPGMPDADISQSNNQARTGTYGLRVEDRDAWYAGPAQRIDHFVKPGQQYSVEAWVKIPLLGITRNFHISIYTKGKADGSAQFDTSTLTPALPLVWNKVSGTVTAPAWDGDLEYAFVKIAGADGQNTIDFYLDDFSIKEAKVARFIYRQVLGPGINTLYPGAPTNAQGLYWINCNGQRLIIERSRIRGTLLVVNPGANSCVGDGPINWSPAVAGYPALLVDADNESNADFAIHATNRSLSESEDGTNYNPAGAAHEQLGQDADINDIYRSEIRGLVAIRDDLTYANRPLIRGQLFVGDDIDGSSGELEVDYLPDSLLNPPPGFLDGYLYQRRPASVRKAVLP